MQKAKIAIIFCLVLPLGAGIIIALMLLLKILFGGA